MWLFTCPKLRGRTKILGIEALTLVLTIELNDFKKKIMRLVKLALGFVRPVTLTGSDQDE